jgi:hypothetical protein
VCGRSQSERIKENAASASELALQLAQDKEFRKRLLSAIEHGARAGRRARRRRGAVASIARLATDKALLSELSSARRDLAYAQARVEKKKRSHKLRNLILLTGLAALASAPRSDDNCKLRRARQ